MKATRNTKLCFFPLPPRNDDVHKMEFGRIPRQNRSTLHRWRPILSALSVMCLSPAEKVYALRFLFGFCLGNRRAFADTDTYLWIQMTDSSTLQSVKKSAVLQKSKSSRSANSGRGATMFRSGPRNPAATGKAH